MTRITKRSVVLAREPRWAAFRTLLSFNLGNARSRKVALAAVRRIGRRHFSGFFPALKQHCTRKETMVSQLMRLRAWRNALLALLAAHSLLPLLSQVAAAFPEKVVKIIVPTSPGGLMDVAARLIQPKLSDAWKVPVIVENKPGAGMALGTAQFTQSAPDGYTLLLAHEGAVVINPIIVADTNYSVKNFEPLAQVWDTSLVFVVNKDVPATNLKELDEYIKKNPGKVNYALNDMIGELIADMVKQKMGWDFAIVSYKGNPERLRSIAAGETQMTLASATDAIGILSTNSVRAIGISALTRSPRLPTIPTLDEAGMKGFNFTTWGGLFALAGTPAPIVAKLSADARRALAEPDVVERIESGGSQIGRITAEQFKQRIAADIVRWRQLAEQRGMRTYDH